MIQEIPQFREIDICHINPGILDDLHFHDHVMFFVLDIFIVQEKSALIELRHVQDTVKLLNDEEVSDLKISFSQKQSFPFLS